ncbi:MAG TPA: hypothetical protein VHD32_01755 [Candidatus Didemnitutus sp.]|nr:hypothetical protein [Candidatus Didemnitutus sp.]
MKTRIIPLFLILAGTTFGAMPAILSPQAQAELNRENNRPPVRPTDSLRKMDFQVPTPPENHRFTRDKGGFLAMERVGPVDLKIGVWPSVQSFLSPFIDHTPPEQQTRVSFELAKIAW